MKKTHWKFGVIVAAVLALAGGGAWWYSQKQAASEVQYRTSKIERGNLQASVSASGAVNPVTQVSVGTQVSGQIKELYVDFNSEVKAGQLIALIDPETFEYRVRSAQADVDSARALVLTAQANVASSRAQVSRARMDLTEAQRDAERQQMLVDKQFVAQSVSDKARALVSASSESVKVAEAQMAVTAAQVKSAEATVAQRESSLAQARIDLARTKITSPVNGIVIKRSIEKGQTVAASLSSPELFVIAQNLQDMQVDASIDESDVGRIRTGQKATFTVDAFAGQTFEGEVRQVRKAAQNVANVVTYVAVIGFSNAGGRLLPGMTANVRVVTEARENVLKVPNASLRMKIAGVEPATAVNAGATKSIAAQANNTPARSEKEGEKADSKPAAAPAISTVTAKPAAPAAAAPSGVADTAGAAGGANNPATQFRNRLVAELALGTAQIEKVDGIYADARPKFMVLRDLPQEERAKARERITADIRAKLRELMAPEQKPRFDAIVAEAASRQSTRGRIYVMDAKGKPRAYNVRLGISDGSSTELILTPNSPDAAELVEGALVITGTVGAGGSAAGPASSGQRPAAAGPRMAF